MDDALEAAVRASTLVWINEKEICNEKGRRILIGPESPHYFLEALYEDESKEIAVQKPSQIGVSTWAILTELHDARYFGINQIHTLPAGKDVQQFVPSKVNEIISNNASIRAGMDKKNVDAVMQKQFGKGFLYYKGTKGESDTLMLSSDRNWYDEVDASDQGRLADYDSRLESEASLKQKRYISTPTMPGYGINLHFLDSDQKHWRFKCPHCKHEQHMSWPENIDLEKGRYVCSKCAGTITHQDIRRGKWKAKFPGRSPDPITGEGGVSGYQLTQMIAPWVKPRDMIKAFKDAELGRNDMTMEYFYNHKLGLPYVTSSSQIPASLIYQNLTMKEVPEVNSVMGVDVQLHELYIMLGNEEGVYGILRVRDEQEWIDTNGKKGKSKWDRWAELMEIYDVRYCVIDGGFTPNEVMKAAKKFPGRVWVNWYKEDPKKAKIIRWADTSFTDKEKSEEEEMKVLTDRNRALDMLLQNLKNGSIRFIYRKEDPAVAMLVKHVETTYARIVTDRLGLEKREWVSTGKDDLLHAMVYFMIAMERKRMNEAD